MGKISDYDVSKQDINVQDTIDDIKNVINNGAYELKITTASSPGWRESVNGVLVLAIFGASTRLYVSNNNTSNGWAYVDFTDL
jgi:hypothetical protein